MNMKIENTHIREIANGEKPQTLIIMFHGYAVYGARILTRFSYWDNKNCAVVAPDAFDIVNNNPKERSWCSLDNQWNLDGTFNHALMYERLLAIERPIIDFIEEQLVKYKLEYKDLILMGFSQGAALVMHMGLRLPQQCKAVIPISGRLVHPKKLAQDLKHKPAILLIHGDQDQVITPDYFYLAKEFFEQENFVLHSHLIPNLEHVIDRKVVKLIDEFVFDL